MREYEILFVTEINDSLHQNAKEKIREILKAHKAEIFHEADYGIHTLSYPIRKITQGKYHFFHFKSNGSEIASIEKELRYDLDILRFLIVKLEEIVLPKEEKKEEKVEA